MKKSGKKRNKNRFWTKNQKLFTDFDFFYNVWGLKTFNFSSSKKILLWLEPNTLKKLPVSIRTFAKYKDLINWNSISLNYHLDLKFISKFKRYLDAFTVSKYQKLSPQAIDHLSDWLDWMRVSKYQKVLSCHVKNFNKITIQVLVNNNYSFETIIQNSEKFKSDSLYWYYLSQRIDISADLLKQYVDKLDLKKVLNSNQYSWHTLQEVIPNIKQKPELLILQQSVPESVLEQVWKSLDETHRQMLFQRRVLSPEFLVKHLESLDINFAIQHNQKLPEDVFIANLPKLYDYVNLDWFIEKYQYSERVQEAWEMLELLR